MSCSQSNWIYKYLCLTIKKKIIDSKSKNTLTVTSNTTVQSKWTVSNIHYMLIFSRKKKACIKFALVNYIFENLLKTEILIPVES